MAPEPWFAALRAPDFPAQALSAQNPLLRGRPFAVVEQKADNHKTHLIAVSKAARHRGVEAGMPAFFALRRWRGLHLHPRHPLAEAKLHAAVAALCHTHTPTHFSKSFGKTFLDMTGTPALREAVPEVWAKRMQSELEALGLDSVALGMGSTRIIAEVLSRLAEPGEIRLCPPGGESLILNPVSPGILPGLSPHAREQFRKYGLRTVEQIKNLEKEELEMRFGQEAEKIYGLVRGRDFETVVSTQSPIEAETVLPEDLNDDEALRGQVRLTADKLGHALRIQERKAGRLTLALRYSDGKVSRRSAKLHPPTSAFLKIAETVETLFQELHQRRVALRRIGLEVVAPTVDTGQTDLFEESASRKQENLARALDRIRVKRSFRDVVTGSSLAQPRMG